MSPCNTVNISWRKEGLWLEQQRLIPLQKAREGEKFKMKVRNFRKTAFVSLWTVAQCGQWNRANDKNILYVEVMQTRYGHGVKSD